jgi:DNA polymerase-3 subunit epsilon
VRSLRSLFAGAATTPAGLRRWAVVDVETSGLDPRRDDLLAVAAVALRIDGHAGPRIDLADSFEAVLRRAGGATDKDNVLLHGIGVGEQGAGAPPAQVLAAFGQWLGPSPLVAFHAEFDRAVVRRAMQHTLGRPLANPWLDLAPVAEVLHPNVGARSLDDWLAHFGIDCAVRHQAAADALATAELLLRLWPAARAQRCTSFAALRDLAGQRRWLAGR